MIAHRLHHLFVVVETTWKVKTATAIVLRYKLTVDLVIASESCDRNLIENWVVQFRFAGNRFTEVPEGDLLLRFGKDGLHWWRWWRCWTLCRYNDNWSGCGGRGRCRWCGCWEQDAHLLILVGIGEKRILSWHGHWPRCHWW